MPDNSPANLDYGWLGQAQKGLEHAPGIATIEMGARQYVPATGRFLQVDPVPRPALGPGRGRRGERAALADRT